MDADRDPFRDVVLDEYFVAAARTREPPASARARPVQPPITATPDPSSAAVVQPRIRFLAMLVTVAVVGLAAWTGPASTRGLPSALDSVFQAALSDDTWPTPQRAASPRALGTPPPVQAGSGSFRFAAHQPDSRAPVAYDPCRPIGYVVNLRGAPRGGGELVHDAVRRIQEATGLQFVFEGTTDEAPMDERRSFQPERYGDRWAPVLIAWSDPTEIPVLTGAVAGVGGSNQVQRLGQPYAYVTGQVVLDAPQLADAWSKAGSGHVSAVIIHELGHLVGLDHVDDATQLMYPRTSTTNLQAGDLTGLSHLGAGPCVPLL